MRSPPNEKIVSVTQACLADTKRVETFHETFYEIELRFAHVSWKRFETYINFIDVKNHFTHVPSKRSYRHFCKSLLSNDFLR